MFTNDYLNNIVKQNLLKNTTFEKFRIYDIDNFAEYFHIMGFIHTGRYYYSREFGSYSVDIIHNDV